MVQAPAAPHLAPSRLEAPRLSPDRLERERPSAKERLWVPKRILITRSARGSEVAQRAAERGAMLGAEVTELKGDQVRGLRGETEAETYRLAKSTLAIVNAPPSSLKLQPIPPSADFRLDLAVGCPAHCQYCYLAGSLKGPPVTRAYANLEEVLAVLPRYLGEGRVTSRSDARAEEGTTFEASCYTDPLGIEHLTGSLSRTIEHFARWHREGAEAGLRFTTKYSGVGPLLNLEHGGRTRIRFSVNAEVVTRRFEGGTAPLGERLTAMGEAARAGYPVGLTIAPIMPVEGWREAYEDLLTGAAKALPEGADLTCELITHRFTPGSREVLMGWYPASKLEMDPEVRAAKRNKFGGVKYVYPKKLMGEMKAFFEEAAGRLLPRARLLYWT
jgi:spore photoproduct lyase